MNAWSELVERVLQRQDEELVGLSPGAHDELERAIRNDPASFATDPEDAAFLHLARALDRHALACANNELIDNDLRFFEARSQRLAQLAEDCQAALEIDSGCTDAALIAILARDDECALTLEALFKLQEEQVNVDAGRPEAGVGLDGAGVGLAGESANRSIIPQSISWTDVRSRHYLRIMAAISRCCLETAHYRMAAEVSSKLLAIDAVDHLGARRTLALALARLEDPAGLEELDLRFGRHGDAWLHLARTVMHFKLDQMPAARRALAGFIRLVDGAAYALLRPVMVDTYLPDRPEMVTAYEEATMAVWEAEPIICDIPDFPFWAAAQPGVTEAAEAFARRNGFDW